MAAPLFVARQHVAQLVAIVPKRLVEQHDAPTRNAEPHADTLVDERFAHHLRPGAVWCGRQATGGRWQRSVDHRRPDEKSEAPLRGGGGGLRGSSSGSPLPQIGRGGVFASVHRDGAALLPGTTYDNHRNEQRYDGGNQAKESKGRREHQGRERAGRSAVTGAAF